jgi:hypothetical protein
VAAAKSPPRNLGFEVGAVGDGDVAAGLLAQRFSVACRFQPACELLILTRALEYYDAYLRSEQREDTEVSEPLVKLKGSGGD